MNVCWSLVAACIVAVVQMQAVYAFYLGDVVLTDAQMHTVEAHANQNSLFAPQDAVVKNTRQLWPNAVVPYIIDNSLGSRARNAIQQAIDGYKQLSCVNFIPRTTESDYVRFYLGNGCFSYIGRVGGSQDISIGRGCEYIGIVMHEMFHALGRFHEQSRPDRDQFVRINLQNIQSGRESNFDKTSTSFVTTQGVAYDFGSVMHYGATAFSKNGQPTIEPIDSRISPRNLGQRDGLSPLDIEHVNTLYCGGGATGSWSQWQQWSSCSLTCNGGTRTRTRTCNGGTGCPGSNIDTQMCNTNSCPVPATWGSWTQWGECSNTCGGGRQQRSRQCVGGNNCIGNNAMFRDCNTQSCPQPATWSNWGSWSSCSATCQGGMRDRSRRCQNGRTCPGRGTETESCKSNTPCTTMPQSKEWSQWGSCSKPCGGGERFRMRMCATGSCTDHQKTACNTQSCKPEPHLRGLQHEGCYYLPGFSNVLSVLDGNYRFLMDYGPNRTQPIEKCGIAAQLNRNSVFGVAFGFCISGSSNVADYKMAHTSNQCENGVGDYNFRSGVYSMDIYKIQNPVAFQDSLSQVAGTPQPNVTDSNIVGSGAPVISSSFILLLSFITITLFCGLL